MYTNFCTKCNQEVTTNAARLFINHVRWCKSTERNTGKFLLKCSCVVCHEEVTAQNLEGHHKSKHTVKGQCTNCHKPLTTKNKFCSRSCSASYTNKHKDYSSFKSGPKKGSVPSNYFPYTKISWCILCNKIHPGSGQTCSTPCRNKLASIRMKEAIANGHDPKKNRGRGKKSYLEISFEKWLNKHFPDIEYRPEYPVKRQDMVKTYFGDFYFPDKNLIIELDGTQHNNTIEYDQERDTYITETYGIQVFRISHKEYTNQTKINDVIKLLS